MIEIRPFRPEDRASVWGILPPILCAGETCALLQKMSKAEAIAYWTGPDRETFVAEEEGQVVGTYYLRANQLGGGSHVANCGYVTSPTATGRGIARAVRLWESFSFERVGRLPSALLSPQQGYVEALVMFRELHPCIIGCCQAVCERF